MAPEETWFPPACGSLLAEHRQMEMLLAQLSTGLEALETGTAEGMSAIRTLLERIAAEMDVHFACEEQALFPAVSARHPMDLMEAEHIELMALRDRLLQLGGKSDPDRGEIAALNAVARKFIDELLDHIGREDAGIFPTCERALSGHQKAGVRDEMARIRRQFPAQGARPPA